MGVGADDQGDVVTVEVIGTPGVRGREGLLVVLQRCEEFLKGLTGGKDSLALLNFFAFTILLHSDS